MKTNQQIIFQLREAGRLASLPNPHARRLALLLLDNLAELLLRWNSDFHLCFDRTSWMGVRKHPVRTRQEVDRRHAKLLRFAQSQGWIEEATVDALTYCHQVRNTAYHDGDADSESCDLSILLLASFLREYLPRHHSGKGHTIVTSTAVSLQELDRDPKGNAYVSLSSDAAGVRMGSLSDEYWERCVRELLPPPAPRQVSKLLKSRTKEAFDSAKRRLDFIKSDGVDVGLYNVVEERFFNAGMITPPQRRAPRLSVPGALNMYLALLPKEEDLLDVADPRERIGRLQFVLKAHKPNMKAFSASYLRQQHKKVTDALGKGPAVGMRTFLATHRELQPVFSALAEFSLDLDGYIQSEIDRIRGK